MRSKTVLTLFVLFAWAAVAAAQLSPKYADWADGPEGFLLTKEERKAWENVTNDREAKHFIELFWAKRNPKPGSPFNEFRARYEGMITYCDENFGYEGTRGALSDLGKVFLLMGPPHYAENKAPSQTVSGTGGATMAGQSDRGTDEVRAKAKMWVYEPSKLDPKFKTKGSRILFVFYEQELGSNHFVLDRSHREATMAMRALKKAPEVYLLHPELTTVPKPVSVPGGKSASDARLAAIAGTDAGPLQDQLHALEDLGVADADHRPLWVHLGLPEDQPELDTLAGRVIDPAEDEVLSTFEIGAKPLAAGGQRAYHLTFPLAPGSYRIEVGGFTGNELQFVYKADAGIPEVPEGTWFSPVWVGLDAVQEKDVLLGEAYTFGTWHLMPLAVTQVPKNAQLSYFGYVVRPQVEEGKDPSARLKLTVKKDGQRLGRPLSLDLPMVKVADGVYMYANALNLAAFPAAGKYTLEFKVSESGVDGAGRRTVEVELVE